MNHPNVPPSIQARMSQEDPRLYNVNRDVAHNFHRVAELVAGRMEDDVWPDLGEILAREGVDQDDLGDACEAFCNFIGSSFEYPQEDMQAALERCGWMKLKPGAQIAVMAYLGTVNLGMHFAGVREATLGGEGPPLTLRALCAQGAKSAALITEGRWTRRWRRLRLRMTAIKNALLGRW